MHTFFFSLDLDADTIRVFSVSSSDVQFAMRGEAASDLCKYHECSLIVLNSKSPHQSGHKHLRPQQAALLSQIQQVLCRTLPGRVQGSG